MGCWKTSLLAVVALAAVVYAADVKEAFEKNGIVPDVIAEAPAELLEVSYGSKKVELGNELTPTEVKDIPTLKWKADADSFYLLIMTDPDAPRRSNPIVREFRHWMVGNIPGDSVKDGDALTEYVGSGPPKDTGLHRYVFLLYKQPEKIKFDEPHVTNKSRDFRPKFSASDFAKKYKLGNPIAGNFYQAQYDDYVPTLHAQLGFDKPT